MVGILQTSRWALRRYDRNLTHPIISLLKQFTSPPNPLNRSNIRSENTRIAHCRDGVQLNGNWSDIKRSEQARRSVQTHWWPFGLYILPTGMSNENQACEVYKEIWETRVHLWCWHGLSQFTDARIALRYRNRDGPNDDILNGSY